MTYQSKLKRITTALLALVIIGVPAKTYVGLNQETEIVSYAAHFDDDDENLLERGSYIAIDKNGGTINFGEKGVRTYYRDLDGVHSVTHSWLFQGAPCYYNDSQSCYEFFAGNDGWMRFTKITSPKLDTIPTGFYITGGTGTESDPFTFGLTLDPPTTENTVPDSSASTAQTTTTATTSLSTSTTSTTSPMTTTTTKIQSTTKTTTTPSTTMTSLTCTTTIIKPPYSGIRFGDVNLDGKITIEDVNFLSDFLQGKSQLSPSQIANADVYISDNYSSPMVENIDAFDLYYLKGYVLDEVMSLPVFGRPGDTLPADTSTSTVIVSSTTTIIPTTLMPNLKGDVNEDSTVDIMDCILINKFLVGVSSLTNVQKKIADMNDDGIVAAEDSLAILKVVLGLKS